jgi:hypothetical protein
MYIHSTNHARRPDNSTHRLKCEHSSTKGFKVVQATKSKGIALQAKCRDFTWDVSLSPEETAALIQALIKE